MASQEFLRACAKMDGDCVVATDASERLWERLRKGTKDVVAKGAVRVPQMTLMRPVAVASLPDPVTIQNLSGSHGGMKRPRRK